VESETASGVGDNFSLTIDNLGNNERTRYFRIPLLDGWSVDLVLTLPLSPLANSSQQSQDISASKAVSMPKAAGAHDSPNFQNELHKNSAT
jgi:hypothetical protein